MPFYHNSSIILSNTDKPQPRRPNETKYNFGCNKCERSYVLVTRKETKDTLIDDFTKKYKVCFILVVLEQCLSYSIALFTWLLLNLTKKRFQLEFVRSIVCHNHTYKVQSI